MSRHQAGAAVAVVILSTLVGTPLWADELSPVVVASIHDEPRDGLGDSFNAAPFDGLLREVASREDRAIQEFDLSPYAGMTVTSATIRGLLYVNNGGGTWPRTFDFVLYAGNGQADLTDFEIAGTVVGAVVWEQGTNPLPFSFDVAATVQTLLNGGAHFVGLKVDPTSDNSFPSILTAEDSRLTIVASGGIVRGDLNCDGRVDFNDINPFVLALSDPAGYQQQFPNCSLLHGDCNGDGQVNFGDINAFVELLSGQ